MSAPAVLRAADRRERPWKNGGGVTAQIAASPPDGGLDAFDWRVSIARVEAAGPFSCFPGVDRTLAVLDGALHLAIDGGVPVGLDPASPPLAFAADVPAHGRPDGGAVIDLNVMVRRGCWNAKLRRLGEGRVAADHADIAILVATQPLTVAIGGSRLALDRFDAVRLDGLAAVDLTGDAILVLLARTEASPCA